MDIGHTLSPSANDQPSLSQGHKVYPYLLRDLEITRPNQVHPQRSDIVRLFIVDGAKALRRTGRDTFGDFALIRRNASTSLHCAGCRLWGLDPLAIKAPPMEGFSP